MKAVVVIPTYNERANIEQLVAQIHQHAPDLHILIVDDNSPDGTGELAEQLSSRHPDRIFALHRNKKEGLGKAYVAGFRYALSRDYGVVLQMDADLSHDPKYLPLFLKQIEDCDLVLGSRYLHGISVVHWDFKRLFLSKAATKYVQLITGMPFTDTTGGFKCWRRDTLELMLNEGLFSNGYLFQIETTYKAYRHGCRISEASIIFTDRLQGTSKMNWGIIREATWGVLRLRLNLRRKFGLPRLNHSPSPKSATSLTT